MVSKQRRKQASMLDLRRARRSSLMYALALLAVLWLNPKASLRNLQSGAIRHRSVRTRATHSDDLPSITAARSCDVPLCIIAHGVVANDAIGVLHLQRYLAAHPAVPALVLLQKPGAEEPTVEIYNIGPQSKPIQALLRKQLQRTQGNVNTMLNAMHTMAVSHVRACSIWEMDTNATLLKEKCISSQISKSLRPRKPLGSGKTPLHVGVRPRGTGGSSHLSDATDHLPVVNAYTLLSPTAYYAPRGFPEELIGDDERGRGAHAPELVRIGLPLPEAKSVIVIQSSIDGVPDTTERYLPARDEPVRHSSFVPAVVLPLGVLHPYNRVATLHRYDALWALFSPVSAQPNDSDIVRGYVAQAIFPIIGRHLAIVEPLVYRNVTVRNQQVRSTPPDALMMHLAKWGRFTRDQCSQRMSDCLDAGSLLVALYAELARSGLCSQRDAAEARLWVKQLRSTGYAFPAPSVAATPLISPRRPQTLNVHAAVHLNWGKHWRGVVPLWHAMHGAEFEQVTYHVLRRPDVANPLQAGGIYPRITYYLDDPPGITSGYLAFQSAIQAWSVHDRAAEALLWSHDDAFTNHEFLHGWLKNTSTCVAVSDRTDYLPSNVTEWSSSEWFWAKESRTQTAAKHFLELMSDRGKGMKCVGRDFAKSGFAFAQSDVVAIRTTCNGTEPQLLFDLLQAASDAGLWLEISWPNCIRCAFEERSIFGYRLHTRWNAQRNKPSRTWAEYLKHQHDVYHPLKLTGALMARLSMRDDGWLHQRALDRS